MLSYLTSINIVLLLFNLIPAFPLDGGRIARAIIWKVTGDRTRATNIAARLGQGFSYLLIGVGIFWVAPGRPDRRAVVRLHRHVPRPGRAVGDLPDRGALADRGSHASRT